MKAFFFLDLYENDVISDLPDTFPGDDVFTFPAEKITEFSGPGNDQGSQTTAGTVKFDIHGTAETPAGTNIDNFFLL